MSDYVNPSLDQNSHGDDNESENTVDSESDSMYVPDSDNTLTESDSDFCFG